MKKTIKVLSIILSVIVGSILIILAIRFVGMTVNKRVPENGINESRYVEINGTKQWISIYGDNKDNPVLLYLHGGPGSATSNYDYAFTRKWSDVYTVVTWDQRNCGKSYDKSQNGVQLTYDLLMSDGVAMTEYLLDCLSKDKITILGHSWGSYFGANLVLEYPQYYDAFIGTGQLVDMYDNEVAFKQEATKWVGSDKDGLELLNKLNPEQMGTEHYLCRNKLMIKYGYDMFADGMDYNVSAAQFFNPYYSLTDWIKLFNIDDSVYMNFLNSDEFNKFSLKNRTEYKVPYYNINGDRDYQTNYIIAQDYFDRLTAPYKQMFIMEDTTHGLLESKSEEFSLLLHKIADNQKTYKSDKL